MSDFDRRLRAVPPALAAVAFFLGQGKTDEVIAMWRERSVNTIRRQVHILRHKTQFCGSRTRLALAIREAIA